MGERAIINGAHDTNVFQTLLDKFIDKYVLCENCRLPEIDMSVNKKSMIVAKCKACGWGGELDNAHRLATFIQKNPPDGQGGLWSAEAEKGGGKLDRKARQLARAEKARRKEAGEEVDDDDDDESDKKEKKEKKDKKEKKKKDKD